SRRAAGPPARSAAPFPAPVGASGGVALSGTRQAAAAESASRASADGASILVEYTPRPRAATRAAAPAFRGRRMNLRAAPDVYSIEPSGPGKAGEGRGGGVMRKIRDLDSY